MRNILVAAHGLFSDGILDAMRLIMGDIVGVSALNAFVETDFDLAGEVKSHIDGMADGKELIVVTDMLGGSVNNEFMRYVGRERFHLITGLNLPLLLELAGSIEDAGDTVDMLRNAVSASSGTVVYCNDALAAFRNRDTGGTGGSSMGKMEQDKEMHQC